MSSVYFGRRSFSYIAQGIELREGRTARRAMSNHVFWLVKFTFKETFQVAFRCVWVSFPGCAVFVIRFRPVSRIEIITP